MTDTTAKNPFEYRTTPKNNWELIWWALTDDKRIEEYINFLKLNNDIKFIFTLKIAFFTTSLACLAILIILLITIFTFSVIDIFNNTPSNWWNNEILLVWTQQKTIINKISSLYSATLKYFIFSFFTAKMFTISFSLLHSRNKENTFNSIILGNFWSFISIMIFSVFNIALFKTTGLWLLVPLLFGITLATVMGFNSIRYGLLFNIIIGLLIGILFFIVFWLLLGIILGFNVSFYIGLVSGLAFTSSYYLYFFSIWFVWIIYARFCNIDNNPYVIIKETDLSFFMEKRIIKQAQQNPVLVSDFVIFLLEHHPKNKNIAALLTHTARAILWEKAALYLDETVLELPEFAVNGFIVPEKWQTKLTVINTNLIIAEQTPQISLKKELFTDFVQALEEFRMILLVPRQLTWRDKISMTRRIDWQYYYREAIEEWIRIAKQKLTEYEEIAQRTEPISRNFYLTGAALVPERNEVIFMNRTDLHNELSLKIHTTSSLAVLFLQGQRRVGKTSLVKFLPKILGRRFEVISLDLQGNITSVEDFLFKLRREFNTKFAITEKTEWLIPPTWAAALHELYAYIGEYAKAKDVKIILAIDEYEYLQQHLSKDLAQAQEFLGAFRHFSQHQDHISLMFVGLKFFSELQNPNWNEYFVNAISIRVDYLNQEESFKLIEVSKLDFEAGAKEKIFELTQGHPALIQKICYEIVNIANVKGSKHIAWADVEKALKIMIYVSVNGVTDIFWTQTCEFPEDKEVVWAIIEKQEIPKTHRLRLRRLIEYGFILENEAENSYALRVPIFEQWVKKFS